MKKLLAASLVAVCLGAPAMAQDSGSRFTAAISGGTLGIGPEVGFRVSDHFGVRGSAGLLNISHGFDSDDVDYDGKVKLQSYGVMLDLFPFGGSFRVSGGARINKNRVRATAAPTTDTEIGDVTYTPAQIGTLRGTAEVKDFAPALTLGWGGSNRSGFFFGTEAGVLFQGKLRINRFTASGSAASNPAFQANLERERLDLQDDVDDYKLYPILQIAIGYRF